MQESNSRAITRLAEPWRLALTYLRRPSTLQVFPSAVQLDATRIPYQQLLRVTANAPWFLPRWMGGRRLTFHWEADQQQQQSSVLTKVTPGLALQRELVRAVTHFLTQAIAPVGKEANDLCTQVQAIYRQDRYVRHSHASRLATENVARLQSASALLEPLRRHPLLTPALREQAKHIHAQLERISPFLIDLEPQREAHNRRYLESASQAEASYFDNVESNPLTPEQLQAALVFEDATLVVAAAGSGKSSCIVAKIGFALKAGLFQDHEILALAYNKGAAESLAKRLNEKLSPALGRGVKVQSRTFHSFGLATMVQARGPEYEPKVLKEDAGEEGRFIKDVIADLAENNPQFQRALAEWMVTAPHSDPQPIGVAGDVDECAKRYEECCRQRIRAKRVEGRQSYEPTIPTLDAKIYVRSLEERSIANWLLLRGVPFFYEQLDWEGAKRLNLGLTAKGRKKPYKPDFTYNTSEVLRDGQIRPVLVIHEHFALDSAGRAPDWMGGEVYAKQARSKRAMFALRCKQSLHASVRIVFIETTSAQLRDGSIWLHLEKSLRDARVQVNKPSEEVYRRAVASFRESNDLERLLIDFVLRHKDSGLSSQDVVELARKQPNFLRAQLFLRVASLVSAAYQEALKKADKIDYADMLREAVIALREQQVKTPYRFVLVDEFQDIAQLKADLVKAVLDQAPEASVVFCVGDDWQTINRFSGSDVSIFTGIGQYFQRHTRQLILPRTFRCADGIAEVSRALVLRNPGQIDKPVTAQPARLPHSVRVVLHGEDAEQRVAALEGELLRIEQVGRTLQLALPSVQLLMRTQADGTAPRGLHEEKYLKDLKRRYAGRLVLETMSIHGSKGLEADFVILAGLDSGFRGFPDERAVEPLMELVLPRLSDPNEEERRLMYVGLTRARHQVTVLSNREAPSEYVLELDALRKRFEFIEWSGDEMTRVPCPKCKVGSLRATPSGGSLSCTRTVRCGCHLRVPVAAQSQSA